MTSMATASQSADAAPAPVVTTKTRPSRRAPRSSRPLGSVTVAALERGPRRRRRRAASAAFWTRPALDGRASSPRPPRPPRPRAGGAAARRRAAGVLLLSSAVCAPCCGDGSSRAFLLSPGELPNGAGAGPPGCPRPYVDVGQAPNFQNTKRHSARAKACPTKRIIPPGLPRRSRRTLVDLARRRRTDRARGGAHRATKQDAALHCVRR